LNQAPNFEIYPNDTMIYVTNSTSLTSKIGLSSIIDDEAYPVEVQIICEQIGRLIQSQGSYQKFSPLNA
jgi:hypothetical protein